MVTKYNFDPKGYYKLLIPLLMRVDDSGVLKPEFEKLLNSMGSMFFHLQLNLFNEMSAHKTKLAYNCIDMVLEKYLNDTFDNDLRRIEIIENNAATSIQASYYLHGETDPSEKVWFLDGEVDASEKIFYQQNETFEDFNFTVNVPNAITENNDVIQGEINRYKKATKTNNIVRI
jgi:hypothetical protein